MVEDSYGKLFESHVRRVAAAAGVPDFVYRSVEIQKGNAQRGVGDAMLWIGKRLVVVSMKSRVPTASDTAERAGAWLPKHISKALRQIEGTVRTLRNPPPGLILRSERGVSVPWRFGMLGEVTGAVVVYHPQAGQYQAGASSGATPTVILAADDWRFIHERLWSTSAVVKYLSWRARCGITVPLAAERDVFAAAMIEEADRPDPKTPTPMMVTPGLWDRAAVERPGTFFGMSEEDRFAGVIDLQIAAAADDPEFSNVRTPSDYLEIVEFLDRILPFHRVTIAKAMLARCDDVGRHRGPRAMLAATPSGLLVFVADAAARPERTNYLQALTLARHSQTVEASGDTNLVALGVATEGLGVGGRSHDFCLVRGKAELDEVRRRERDEIFGALPTQALIALDSVVDRSTP